MESQAKKQKTDDIESRSLVWLDDSVDSTEENISIEKYFRTLDPDLKTYKKEQECEHYIKCQFRRSHIILIVSGKLGQKFIPIVHELPQIISIYIFCMNKEFHEKWAKEFTKVKDVFKQPNELKQRILKDHFDEKQTTITITTLQIQWTYEIDNEYIISDICIDYLSQMKTCSTEKNEFISLCQEECQSDPQRTGVLEEFQENYCSTTTLSWFKRDSFFYQIIEKAFQSTNITTMYRCRFFLRDIQKQFEQYKCTSTIHTYQGQLISNENFEKLKNFEGKIIAIKTFLFTTLDRNEAMSCISDQNEYKRVLFDIEADPQIENVKLFIKTNSLFNHNDHNEILFMLGSTFKIEQILYEENNLIIIKMILCANENKYSYINQEKDLIEFVQLQCDISQHLDYSKMLDNLDKFIEKYINDISNDHPDLIRCYQTLGDIFLIKNDLNSSLNFYQKSIDIIKKNLPLNNLKLIENYNKIASIYLKINENKNAIETFKQILNISKEIYGDNDLKLILIYSNIINIYELEQNYSELLLYYTQIYIIMLKHYSIDNQDFAPIYNNIGKTYVGLNQYHIAIGYYKTSIDIKLKTLPLVNESIAIGYKNIGITYEYMGDIEQARIYFDKSADIYRQLYSSTHETVLEIENLIQNISSSS